MRVTATSVRQGRWPRLGLALLAAGMVLAALLGACRRGEAEPTEPPVTIIRSEGETSTPTATPTATPGAPAAQPTAEPTEAYPLPSPPPTELPAYPEPETPTPSP